MEEKITKFNYLKHILAIAIPISIQSLFQSSLSVIDQIMVGSLGEANIASIGLAGKFPTVFFFTLGSISVGASILISQYRGKADKSNISKAFMLCMKWGLILTTISFIISYFFSDSLMSVFSNDSSVQQIGSNYLKIITIGFLPGFIATMLSSLLRNTGKAKLPMYASIAAVLSNTILNYLLIFGHLGLPALGVQGAAIATTIARFIEFSIIIIFFIQHQLKSEFKINLFAKSDSVLTKTALFVTLPIFLSELAWSLGEAVYGIIYGHIGTEETAAMTLIGPVIILSIGLFAGVSQAASILVGNQLGKRDYDTGMFLGKKAVKIGAIGTIIGGVFIILISKVYPFIYNVEPSTRSTTSALLVMFSLVLWIKVSNMILGGILKAGGKTKYVFLMDLLGTWIIGIPLGLLAAFVFNLSIAWVYLIIAFEEFVRLLIGYKIFLSRRWIQTL